MGRPIWRRIKSHYTSSQIEDRAKKWSIFFGQNKKKLKIYWIEFDNIDDVKVGDKARELIESILHQLYRPIFERQDKDNNASIEKTAKDRIKI